MAYTNRTIRLNFDGTDDKYPNLGEDIWVIIANPMLMPASKLQPKTDVQFDAQGQPLDAKAALMGSMEIFAGIVVDWSVYDPNDFSDDPAKIPLPATPEACANLPLIIINAVSEILNKALNPQ